MIVGKQVLKAQFAPYESVLVTYLALRKGKIVERTFHRYLFKGDDAIRRKPIVERVEVGSVNSPSMHLSVKDYLIHKVAITAFVGVHF